MRKSIVKCLLFLIFIFPTFIFTTRLVYADCFGGGEFTFEFKDVDAFYLVKHTTNDNWEVAKNFKGKDPVGYTITILDSESLAESSSDIYVKLVSDSRPNNYKLVATDCGFSNFSISELSSQNSNNIVELQSFLDNSINNKLWIKKDTKFSIYINNLIFDGFDRVNLEKTDGSYYNNSMDDYIASNSRYPLFLRTPIIDPDEYVVRNYTVGLLGRAFEINLTDKDNIYNDDSFQKQYYQEIISKIKIGTSGEGLYRNPFNQKTDDYFYYFYLKKLIAGYSDGLFKPFENITRGETAKILINTMRYKGMIDETRNYTENFSDIDGSNTFYEYIAILNSLEVNDELIMKGYSDGTFRSNDYITRGEVAKVVDLARKYKK